MVIVCFLLPSFFIQKESNKPKLKHLFLKCRQKYHLQESIFIPIRSVGLLNIPLAYITYLKGFLRY